MPTTVISLNWAALCVWLSEAEGAAVDCVAPCAVSAVSAVSVAGATAAGDAGPAADA